MLGRGRRKVERAWAAWVDEAVREWDPALTTDFDQGRGVVTIIGIDGSPEVDLRAKADRVGNYLPDEQRNEMRRRAVRPLERAYVVPDDWVTGDVDLDRDIRRALVEVKRFPSSPVVQDRLALLERHLGRDGADARAAWAAEAYLERVGPGNGSNAVSAGILGHGLDRDDLVARAADLLVRDGDAAGPDQRPEDVHPVRASDFALGILWRDGRARLAELGQRLSTTNDELVHHLVGAAVAAEALDADALRAHHEVIDREAQVCGREVPPYSDGCRVPDHHAAVVAGWLADCGVEVESAEEAVPLEAVTAGSVAVAGATEVVWRGPIAVAVFDSGEVALDASGAAAMPPPPTPALPGSVVVEGDRLIVATDAGSIELDHDWDTDDELAGIEPENVAWSLDRTRLAVWLTAGPLGIWSADGRRLLTHPGPEKDPIFDVVLGADGACVLMSAWSGYSVLDVDRGGRRAEVQPNGIPEHSAFGYDGRLVGTYDSVDNWRVIDADRGEVLTSSETAIRAAIHPTQPWAAFADGSRLWIERYEPVQPRPT